MSPKCLRFDKKTLTHILSHQGITVPSDFFDAPRRADALVFLDQLVRLVLGFDAGINSKEDLRVFLTEHSLRLPRGTLHPTMPVVQRFPVSRFIPDDGERHVTGISILMLYRYLQQFGNICGIFDVSLSDLLRPTAERMRLLASAAADYIEFQETHLPEALQKWEVVERNRAQIEALRDEASEYCEAEQQISKTLAERESEISRLRKERERATESLTKLGEKWVRVKEECDTVTAMQQAAEDDVAKKNAKLERLRNEIESLNNQIVESPQRIQRTLGGLEEQLSRVEKDLEALTTQIPRVQLSIQILEILASRTKEAETMIRMLELDMRKLATAQAEEDKLNEAVQDINRQQSDVVKKLDGLTKHLDELKKKHSHLDDNFKAKKAEIEAALDTLRRRSDQCNSQRRELEESNSKLSSQLPQAERDACDAEQKTNEVDAQVNEILAHMQSKTHHLARKLIGDLQSAKALGFPLGEQHHAFSEVLELLEQQNTDFRSSPPERSAHVTYMSK